MESVKEPRIEASQASLITAAPLPISVVTPEGRRIDTNLATERYFKRTREQIIGTEVGELYSKEDSEKIRDALEECKRVGSSSCEVTAIRGDNTNFPVILNFSSVKDEEGNIINVLVSATDVTELRKQEEELNETVSAFGEVLCKASNGDLSARVELNVIGEKYNPIGKNINSMIEGMSTYLQNIENSRAFFDSTLESIPVGLVLYKADDPDKKWYRTNPALEKMVGYGAEEMIGKRTEQQLFNTDEATKIFLEQRKKYNHGTSYEVPWITKSGNEIIVTVDQGDIRDASGKITDYVFMVRDITKLRKREEELKHAVSAFGEVLSKASNGDLSVRVELDTIGEDYRSIGENINSMIDAISEHEAELESAKLFNDLISVFRITPNLIII